MIANLPDHTWQLIKQGNHQAFETLYRQQYPALYRYALRINSNSELADQSIQNIFVRIWETRERLAEVSSPRAYLLTALRRDLLANKPADNHASLNSLSKSTPFCYSPQDLHIQQEELYLCQNKLSEALNLLPARQREAIYLKFYEELSYLEVAKVMGVRYQSVVNLVYRGLQALKDDGQLRKFALKRIVSAEFTVLLISLIRIFFS